MERVLSPEPRLNREGRSYAIRAVHTELERAKIFRLRYEVYVEEMKREQRHALHDKRVVVEPLDGTAVILGAFAGDRVVGTCRVNFSADTAFDYPEIYDFATFEAEYPGKVAFITKMMVAPEYRRSLLFVDLSKAVFQTVLERGGGVMIIDCNDHLVSAFTRQGFQAYRGRVEHPLFGMVTPMYLDMHDVEHLRRVRSPFLSVLKRIFPNNQETNQ